MKTLSVFVAFLALAASPLVAAQTASVPVDDVGHTGTDTAVIQTVPTDGVGHTGTDTMTASAPYTPALSLQANSSSMVGPNTMKVTAILSADPSATTATTASYTVPLASSDPACTVPASVTVTWTSTTGGLASFSATCSKVTANTTITISSGSASTHFSLNRR